MHSLEPFCVPNWSTEKKDTTFDPKEMSTRVFAPVCTDSIDVWTHVHTHVHLPLSGFLPDPITDIIMQYTDVILLATMKFPLSVYEFTCNFKNKPQCQSSSLWWDLQFVVLVEEKRFDENIQPVNVVISVSALKETREMDIISTRDCVVSRWVSLMQVGLGRTLLNSD